MGKGNYILHVRLKLRKRYLYYGSLVAMFQSLSVDQIDVSLNDLYRNEFFKLSGKFANSKFLLERVEVIRSKQKAKLDNAKVL